MALGRFIYALGIRHVGEGNAALLARHYGSVAAWVMAMDAVAAADPQAEAELDGIAGVGSKLVEALKEFFANTPATRRAFRNSGRGTGEGRGAGRERFAGAW